jgi:WD40 repeat protein
VAFCPDGLHVLSGGDDESLYLWEIETGRLLRRFEGHLGSLLCVAVSPDGRWALTGSDDQTLRRWQITI